MGTSKTQTPTIFHLLALDFLLSYLGSYFFLDRSNPLFGRYCLLGEIFHMGMVSVPVGTSVTGLNPSATTNHIGEIFPGRWVPDSLLLLELPVGIGPMPAIIGK
ncbi:hypothetical protein DSO57_1026698 [Entomophthora muscae]|uniref:Uncharacterized protein n=1 Tax=Entomophthora muscae TaxID=34485 RepID=A0ACC2TZU0_9FUNG|nr:hypothetical protein DSO57_1026698 [Entomophthora muscae]